VARLIATHPQRNKETLHYLSATPVFEKSVHLSQAPPDHLTLDRVKRSIGFEA